MGGRHADRLWMIGGTLAAAVLLTFGWFILISPQLDDAAGLRAEAETKEASLISLRHRLAQLQEQSGRLPEYQAEVAGHRAALPSTLALPELLRQLQRNGGRSGVKVSAVSVGAPAAASGPISALPITLTANGTPADVERFLTELQEVGPRAVLINTASLNADGGSGTATLTANMQAFFTGTPAPATPLATN